MIKRKFNNITKRYLCFPLGNVEDTISIELKVNGVPLFKVPLAVVGESPVQWRYMDMSVFAGSDIEITSNDIKEDEKRLSLFVFADEIPKELMFERQRSQYHFTYRHGIIGDIVGLTYYDGEWHMFAIHTPFRNVEMCWGHAVSKDLIHWEEITPMFNYPYVLHNGVGFIDTNNYLGENTPDDDAMVMMVPQMKRRVELPRVPKQKLGICYMVSTDKGRTWKKSDVGNIVDYGDAPRVYWSDELKRYVLYVKESHKVIHQYLSENMIDWIRIEDIGAIREEMSYEGDPGEIFDMYLDGNPENKMQVMLFGQGGYIVGKFTKKGMMNLHGEPVSTKDIIITNHFGAPVRFTNAPDGRVVILYTLSNVQIPLRDWNYRPCTSLPVELTLRSTAQGPRLFQNPVIELENLHRITHTKKDVDLTVGQEVCIYPQTELVRIEVEFLFSDVDQINIVLFNYKFVYMPKEEIFFLQKTDGSHVKGQNSYAGYTTPLKPKNSSIKFEILVDRTTIEVFGNDGELYSPYTMQEVESVVPNTFISFSASGGSCKILSCIVNELKSIYE